MTPVRALIVDDSALIRRVLTEILNFSSDIEVVGAAVDAYDAREKIKQLNPDVITLDIEMPRMDGISFLEKLMRLRPMPVIIISSLATEKAEVVLRAIELGAVDYVTKPKLQAHNRLKDYAEDIIRKVLYAARSKNNLQRRMIQRNTQVINKPNYIDHSSSEAPLSSSIATGKVIAIGASTGGTVAIGDVLKELPPPQPPILVVQHIQEAFSKPFSERLNRLTNLNVKQAEDGDVLRTNHVYVAPGSHHLLIQREGGRLCCRLDDGDPVCRHRPSVDVLFRSVAEQIGSQAFGIILTGMGKDGAAGMRDMFDAGAKTIAQDEDSSVVWGMPREAIERGGVHSVEALDRVAARLLSYLNG